ERACDPGLHHARSWRVRTPRFREHGGEQKQALEFSAEELPDVAREIDVAMADPCDDAMAGRKRRKRLAAPCVERGIVREQPFVACEYAVRPNTFEAARKPRRQRDAPCGHRPAQAQPQRVEKVGGRDANEVVRLRHAARESYSRRL